MTRRQRAWRRWQRRPELTMWGDARALPYTEGEAVIAPGQIGPAHAGHALPTPVR